MPCIGENMEQLELWHTTLEGLQSFWKTGNSNKMSYIPAVWSSNSTPSINLEKSKAMCSKTTTKRICIATILVSWIIRSPKSWNNSNVRQQNGYTHLVYHTAEDCSARKRNKILIHATTWMALKNTASKRRQTPKSTRYIIPFIWMQE